jgi:hypothetical protein
MKRIQVMSEEDRIKSIKDSQIGMVSAKYNDRPDPEPTYRVIMIKFRKFTNVYRC